MQPPLPENDPVHAAVKRYQRAGATKVNSAKSEDRVNMREVVTAFRASAREADHRPGLLRRFFHALWPDAIFPRFAVAVSLVVVLVIAATVLIPARDHTVSLAFAGGLDTRSTYDEPLSGRFRADLDFAGSTISLHEGNRFYSGTLGEWRLQPDKTAYVTFKAAGTNDSFGAVSIEGFVQLTNSLPRLPKYSREIKGAHLVATLRWSGQEARINRRLSP